MLANLDSSAVPHTVILAIGAVFLLKKIIDMEKYQALRVVVLTIVLTLIIFTVVGRGLDESPDFIALKTTSAKPKCEAVISKKFWTTTHPVMLE